MLGELLGEAIRIERLKQHKSQSDLAADCTSMSSFTISRIERGKGDITFKQISEIAAGLGMSEEELIRIARNYEPQRKDV